MAAKELDSVRLLVDLVSMFDKKPVPAGTEGAVVNVYPDGAIEVDIAFRPQTKDDWGDFDLVTVLPGQYEVIRDGGRT